MSKEDPRRGTPTCRERIIRHILGTHGGIYGAEVCQVCGEVGTYFSLAGARIRHLGYPYEFVGEHGHSAAEVKSALGSRHRYCEVCGTRFNLGDESRLGYNPVCDACRHEIGERERGRPAHEVVTELTRRRYIDLKHPTDEKLRAFDRLVTEMRFELDEGWGGPPKPGLKGTREERWRRTLRQIGKLHGIDYLKDA